MGAVAYVTQQQPNRSWTMWTDPVAPGASKIYPSARAPGAIPGLDYFVNKAPAVTGIAAIGALWGVWKLSEHARPSQKVVARAGGTVAIGAAIYAIARASGWTHLSGPQATVLNF